MQTEMVFFLQVLSAGQETRQVGVGVIKIGLGKRGVVR